MYHFVKPVVTGALILFAATAIAASPKYLITHNNTNVDSNAYIDGTIPSQDPTKANSTAKIFWSKVQLACFGHTVNNKCSAVIYMATNTPNPVVIGTVQLDINTGLITPAQLSANGYTITVNGPGETTLSME